MLAVNPPTRWYGCRIYGLIWRRPLALACDALLLYFLDRLCQRQRLAQLLRARLLQVVVGIFYVFHAQRVEAHDVDVGAAVAAQHVCDRLHVEVRVCADDRRLHMAHDRLAHAQRVLWPLDQYDRAALVLVADPHGIADQ